MKEDTMYLPAPWQAMELRKLPAFTHSPVHWRCACNSCGFYSMVYDTPTEAVAAVLEHWHDTSSEVRVRDGRCITHAAARRAEGV